MLSDVVDDGAHRHVAERHGVARLNVDLLARDDGVAGRKALRRQNVGLLAALVLHQRDEGGAVRIVFDPLDGRGLFTARALEIDDAIGLLVAAAAEAAGDAAVVVAAA
jgi:hypothetical protein